MMIKEKHVDLKILAFIHIIIVTGAIILKVIDPLVVNYTKAIRKADLLNFVIFTPIIMVILSVLVYRSLEPIRRFAGRDGIEPEQLQEIRRAAFNLPLKITGQFLAVILSIVAFVALVVDAYFFKFYPFLDRLVSMGLIWVYTVCSSLAVFVYTRHKMVPILRATSGVAGDEGFRLPIKARFIITALTLSAMVFLFIFVYSFSRINDTLWYDEIESGKALLVSLQERTSGLASPEELKEYLEGEPFGEDVFIVDAEGKYLTLKPHRIPDSFDIRGIALTDPEGTPKFKEDSTSALRVLPLEGPFEGLYAGAVIGVNPAKETRVRFVLIFSLAMGCFLLVFVSVISYSMAHDTSMAVRDVTGQMKKISNARETLFSEVEVTSLDEVGDLTRAFNDLQRVLNSYHRELDNAKSRIIEMERRRANHAIHDYQLLADNVTDVIFTTDLNMQLTYVSPSVQRLRGYSNEESLAQGIGAWFPEDSLRTAREVFRELLEIAEKNQGVRFISRTLELEVTRPGGALIWAEARMNPLLNSWGQPIGLLGVLRDISERKKMEEEMLKVQKLESLGILAGGIAHDFNNLLTSVIGNLSLMELYARSGQDIIELLKETRKVSQQTRSLTQQLLTFSRGGEPVRKQVSISKLLRDAVRFALSGAQAEYELFTPDDLWWAEIDEGQIHQVMNNLLINAEQAMPRGGKIEVSAENVVVQANDTLPLKGGKYVKISIRDQGVGIPEKFLDRIFDPYFSTKPKGSGLGLAITYSILRKHRGYISVESELGVGTIFHLYLPALDRQIFVLEEVKEQMPRTGRGRVLLMDDQPEIRNMVKRMLTHLGYQVEVTANGQEAIALYQEAVKSSEAFDAVILDLTIPGGMGGREAIQKLREIDPQVKAIVSSGYANEAIMSDYEQYGFRGVVAKPYEIKELSEILGKVIEGTGNGCSRG